MKLSKTFKNLYILSKTPLCLLLAASLLISGCAARPKKEYGVFLGIGSEDSKLLEDYKIVVIEAAEFD